ncbi:MAG: ParB/RepB/Spo0J family partition protein [Alphaproteobacteria bacterium]
MTADHQADNADPHDTGPDDWLSRLVHAPAGAVVTSRDRVAPGEPAGAPPEAPGVATPTAVQAPPPALAAAAADSPGPGDAVVEVPVDAIAPNPDQPRRSFDEDELAALAASIAAQGVIQPVVLRPRTGDAGPYQLVAGERRWRAARIAGLATVPAVVRSLDDSRMAEVALVENIQRADLPPLEEAQAYQLLLDRHGYTQDDLARRVGKSRSHVAHMLRLLRLPEAVRAMLHDGRLSVGHARLLVSAADPEGLAGLVVARGLTVRQTEELLKRADRPAAMTPAAMAPAPTAVLEDWAGRLGAALQRPVTLKPGRKGGSVVIRYDTEADLAAILRRMGG